MIARFSEALPGSLLGNLHSMKTCGFRLKLVSSVSATHCGTRGTLLPPISPRAALPCKGILVQTLIAFLFCLSHIQAEAVTAFKSCWELIDGTRKVIFLYGGVLLFRDSFSLQ